MAALGVASAQDAKTPAKKADKADKKGVPVGTIDIGEGKDGKFRFFVRDEAGKLLAMSGGGGFATKDDALKAVEDLREVVAKVTKVGTQPKKKDKDADDELPEKATPKKKAKDADDELPKKKAPVK